MRAMDHDSADATTASARDAALVQDFVRRHLSWRGTLRTHKAALGFDLLRAPLNVALAPVFLLVRLTGLLLIRVRLVRAGKWLASRQVLLRSDVSRRVEQALIDEVLQARMPAYEAPSPQALRLVGEYVGVRSAVAEIATTLIVLTLGLILFQAATPGVLSLAPMVSDRAAYTSALDQFPLGRGIGRAWYGVFGFASPGWYVALVAAGLVCSASVVTTFAGVIADPVQDWTGLHRRRLMRLLTKIDRAEEAGAGLAPEHLLARIADITDAATALLRMLRP
jgi:hypothetical protein